MVIIIPEYMVNVALVTFIITVIGVIGYGFFILYKHTKEEEKK